MGPGGHSSNTRRRTQSRPKLLLEMGPNGQIVSAPANTSGQKKCEHKWTEEMHRLVGVTLIESSLYLPIAPRNMMYSTWRPAIANGTKIGEKELIPNSKHGNQAAEPRDTQIFVSSPARTKAISYLSKSKNKKTKAISCDKCHEARAQLSKKREEMVMLLLHFKCLFRPFLHLHTFLYPVCTKINSVQCVMTLPRT